MGGKRKGRCSRKNKNLGGSKEEPEDLVRAPHSFVVHRGKVGKFVKDLTSDFRQVMEPFTASNVKVRPKNVIKDFVQVAGVMKVSHLVMFTKTVRGPYMKIGRFPRGPTITFAVENYSLGKDVRSSLKRQVTYAKQYANHALLIMNNFTGSEDGKSLELVESMFQNLFPSINPHKVKVGTIRRCVLMNYNKDTKLIDFRHYTIKMMPVGICKGTKKIVQGKVPNLGKCADIGEFIDKGGGLSESEAEEDETSHVSAPSGVSVRGVVSGATSSVRLVELGPRLSLRLVKIEEGLLDGEILHHEFVEKTEEEKKEIRENREKRRREKEKRKKEQEKNIKKKQLERDDHKKKSLAGMEKKEEKEKSWQGHKVAEFKKEMRKEGDGPAESSDDDDAAYYEKEVGEKPDNDMFSKNSRGPKKAFDGGKRFNKKAGVRSSKVSPKFSRNRDDDSKGDRNKKKKRPTKVFNAEGVGPSFRKGSGKDKLRRVKGGKVGKMMRKKR